MYDHKSIARALLNASLDNFLDSDGKCKCCVDPTVAQKAAEMLKAQGEAIDELLKVGYPHSFQREPRWIVNYMYAITDVIKKAVNLRNEVPTIPEGKV